MNLSTPTKSIIELYTKTYKTCVHVKLVTFVKIYNPFDGFEPIHSLLHNVLFCKRASLGNAGGGYTGPSYTIITIYCKSIIISK